MTDLEAAWDALHAATPPGWVVGRPSFHVERNENHQHAFDPSEKAVVGFRQREWTAIARTEVEWVQENGTMPAEIARKDQ